MRHVMCWFVYCALALPAFAGWKENTLAAILVAEAGGEGRIGMEAVAEVLLNRSHQENKGLEGIFLTRGVVSCLNNTTPTKLWMKWQRRDPKTMAVALDIATKAFKNPRAIPSRVKGATFYDIKTRGRGKDWPDGVQLVAVIRNHAFWKEY